MCIYENYSLKAWNTFGLQANARIFVEYDTVEELRQVLSKYKGEKLLHIGCGSNLLFCGDFDGVIMHSHITDGEVLQETDSEVLLRLGAGFIFDEAVSRMVEHGWGGAENLSYIPGEVGASAVQNIGAYGVEVKDIIERVETVEVLTGKERVFSRDECMYGYRDSIFKNYLKGKYIVTYVVFRLQKRPVLKLDYGNVLSSLEGIEKPTLADVRHSIIQIRRQKLPEVSQLGSAGSFFKNPVISKEQLDDLLSLYPSMPHYAASGGEKVPAAWLIEQAGMKGKRVGGAMVYVNQPLVIVNTGDATWNDILKLAQKVQKAVFKKFQIQILPEVNYI